MNEAETNLLLVGKNDASHDLLKKHLEYCGYLVDVVSSEQDLINRFINQDKKPDLILIPQAADKREELISEEILNNVNIPVVLIQDDVENRDVISNIPVKIHEALKNQYQKIKDAISDDLFDAFALHEIICDTNGNPVNYKFLDADRKFLKRIGKAKDELIGKTALDLFPKTEKIWIETFGRVALSGKSEVLVHYSAEFDKYYEARIYSPEKGKFFGAFHRHKAQKKQI